MVNFFLSKSGLTVKITMTDARMASFLPHALCLIKPQAITIKGRAYIKPGTNKIK